MKITQREWRLVEVYLMKMHSEASRNENGIEKPKNVVVSRRSDREFDLSVEGMFRGYGFSAWLLLGTISTRLNWTLPDYPEMVREGDWSGVRDTDNEKLWAIFKHFKLDEIKSYEQVLIASL